MGIMAQGNYKMIITIVNKGKGGKVVDISNKAGAFGGTILAGHGTAVRLMLGVSIEPEKEIVLILVGEDRASNVLQAINKGMNLDGPNKGIAYSFSVDEVVGIHENV
jgi:hypothetical protein